MKQNLWPAHIQDRLGQLAQQVEHLTEQVARTKDAIHGARQRLSGGFQKDQEWQDLNATLQQLVADLPVLERKQRDAAFVLADCKAWLDTLPSDAVLEPVTPIKTDDDLDLETIRQRIADAEDEARQLRAVPTPGDDIEKRIKAHIAAQPRPRVTGVAAGQQLRIDWPNNMTAMLSLLLPEQMTKVAMQEVERQSNEPLPLPDRKKRIVELEAEVESLQRLALALGGDACLMSAPVVLGVKLSRQTKRAA